MFWSHYQRFVKRFAAVAVPLHDLTTQSSEFWWSKQAIATFEELKEKISSLSIIAFPVIKKPFFVFVDACRLAVGAALVQKQENERYHPMEFGIWKLIQEERR